MPRSGMFRFFFFFLTKEWYVVFSASSSSIVAFVADTQLCRSAPRTYTPCGVRYVACRARVALLWSFLGPLWSQWCYDWCALGFSATVAFGCVCSHHVSDWLTSAEVFAVVPLGVSCFLSCWVGRYCAARQSVSCSGGREPVAWVQMQLTRNRHCWLFSK